MSDETANVVVCALVAEMPVPPVASGVSTCAICARPIWVSFSLAQDLLTMEPFELHCRDCLATDADISSVSMTPSQIAEQRRAGMTDMEIAEMIAFARLGAVGRVDQMQAVITEILDDPDGERATLFRVALATAYAELLLTPRDR